MNPAAIARLAATWRHKDADRQQERLDAVRGVFQTYVMIPALKTAIAHFSDDEHWLTVRPPLTALDAQARADLVERLAAVGFDMPGLMRDAA